MELTKTQKDEIRSELVTASETKPVRFLTGGRALNISSGELASKGSNVMYHPVYWNFSKSTVGKICEWLGVKAVWSE